MKLYELVAEFEAIHRELELAENDDEVDEVIARLGEAEGKFTDKAEAIAVIIQSLRASERILKEEVERLNDRKYWLETKTEKLKTYLKDAMERIGIPKVETPRFTISIRNNPQALYVANESTIPIGFFKTERVLMKSAVKAALENGQDIPGCCLVRKTRVDIR